MWPEAHLFASRLNLGTHLGDIFRDAGLISAPGACAPSGQRPAWE
jgi:hypothetical protein